MSKTSISHHPLHATQPSPTRNRGFTIVELLIVIIVIAILAAISIVVYNGIQSRATQTANFAAIRNYLQTFQLMKTETGSLPEGKNSDASCLGSTCATIVGTPAATIGGQIPSATSTNTTKNLLATYGLATQPDIKGSSVTHLVYTSSFFGEPALLWLVAGSNQDCTTSPSRFYVNADKKWTDNAMRSSTSAIGTFCALSLSSL